MMEMMDHVQSKGVAQPQFVETCSCPAQGGR